MSNGGAAPGTNANGILRAQIDNDVAVIRGTLHLCWETARNAARRQRHVSRAESEDYGEMTRAIDAPGASPQAIDRDRQN